jgi:hypothetical protein
LLANYEMAKRSDPALAKPVKYMSISAAGSASSDDTVIEVVSMPENHLGHLPW